MSGYIGGNAPSPTPAGPNDTVRSRLGLALSSLDAAHSILNNIDDKLESRPVASAAGTGPGPVGIMGQLAVLQDALANLEMRLRALDSKL